MRASELRHQNRGSTVEFTTTEGVSVVTELGNAIHEDGHVYIYPTAGNTCWSIDPNTPIRINPKETP